MNDVKSPPFEPTGEDTKEDGSKPEDEFPEPPKLQRQNAELEALDSDSSATDTEVVVVRRQLTKMEKKLNKQIDRRLKKIMQRLDQDRETPKPSPETKEDVISEIKETVTASDHEAEAEEDLSSHSKPYLSTNKNFFYQAQENPFLFV